MAFRECHLPEIAEQKVFIYCFIWERDREIIDYAQLFCFAGIQSTEMNVGVDNSQMVCFFFVFRNFSEIFLSFLFGYCEFETQLFWSWGCGFRFNFKQTSDLGVSRLGREYAVPIFCLF